jgi:hypothetical protein
MIIQKIKNVETELTEYFSPTVELTLVLNPEQLMDMLGKHGIEITAQEFFQEFLAAREFYDRNV